MREEPLRTAARGILRRLGPITVRELARELAEVLEPAGVTPGDADAELDPHELRHLLLDDTGEGFAAFPLADGRLCDIDHLLDGLTLTHVVTGEERAAGRLRISPDLGVLGLLADERGQVPSTDGRPLRRDRGGWLTGGDGWLPEAPVVVVRVVTGAVEVTGVDVAPAADDATAQRLARTHEALVGLVEVTDEVELVFEARARFPRLLSDTHAPLTDLLAAAGLRLVGGAVVGVDEPDPEPDDLFAVLEEHLVHDHELGDAEVADVRMVHDTVEAMLERFAQALAARLDEVPPPAGGPEELGLVLDGLEGGDPAAEGHEDLTLDAARTALVRLLADEDLAFVVAEDLVGGSPLRAVVVAALVEDVEPGLADRASRANAVWLRAVLLELTEDDHAAAEPLLRRALELDPDHLEALLALAGYLDDRGQAGAALGLLRRVDGPGIDAERELLARYARPGPASADRNDPCPCGSGRKFKVCCQATNGWPLQDRIGWVWRKISRFGASPSGQETFAEVAAAAGLPPDAASADQDVAVANLALFEGGMLADLCDLRGALLPPDELDLLRSWSQVRAGAYEVVEVDPGSGCTVLDLRAGERIELRDRSLSRHAEPGDAILAWIVPEPRGPAPATGVVQIPDRQREAVLGLLDDGPDAVQLARWYGSLLAPPALANTDGDPLVLVTRTYRVPDPEAAWAALTERLEEDGDGLVAVSDGDGGSRWLRGSVTRDGDLLTVSTNSVERGSWFAALLAELVPDAELVDEERLPVDELRDAGALHAPPGAAGDGGGPLDLDALDPEDRAALEAEFDRIMAEHEDRWVDTALPALGGATPREAVDDPTRRDALDRLLRDIEQHAAAWDSPGRPMDAGRLRRLLGL